MIENYSIEMMCPLQNNQSELIHFVVDLFVDLCVLIEAQLLMNVFSDD